MAVPVVAVKILILLICSLVSGTESAHQTLLEYSFKGVSISEDCSEEQREMVEDMCDWLEELDSVIAEKEDKYSLDENMVKAVFYCLNFGGRLDEDFD